MNRMKKVIYGNIITVDEHKPRAEALVIEDGIIKYAGSREYAEKLSDGAEIVDYGENFVYPGFMEAHCHGISAAERFCFNADLSTARSCEDMIEIMNRYIADNPDRNVYLGSGWGETGGTPMAQRKIAEIFDAVKTDKPIFMRSADCHSGLLNSAGMKYFGIDANAVKEYGSALVRADENGNPTGYVCENGLLLVLGKLKFTVEEYKKALLVWQDYAFSRGVTAAGEAYADAGGENGIRAYSELDREGKLKLRSFGMHCVMETTETPVEDVQRIADRAKKYNGEHFKINALKLFMDGVIEAHTGWLEEEYADQPGYFGAKRFCDREKLALTIKAGFENGLTSHIHSVGDAATRCALDAIENAELETGNFGMRCALAHLQQVRPADVKRLADLNCVAVVAPLWCAKAQPYYDMECGYVGEERAVRDYPGKAFRDYGAAIAFHTDFPVSPSFDLPGQIYMANMRQMPYSYAPLLGADSCGPKSQRGAEQAIDRMEALKAMTINVAWMNHEENRLGTIETGKIANFTVYDTDFVNCDVEEIPTAKLVATLVEGEEVYKAQQ